jgi:hypothetical protein
MFVIISGSVAVTWRDGLGHVVPILEEGPGDFLAEVGQLSARPALVDARAITDVEALLVPTEALRAVLIAEAELGERIMRALILRRVALIETGAGGPVLIGPADDPDLVRLQGFLVGVALDPKGFVRTGGEDHRPRPLPLESNVPGVFAVGDVRSGSVKRVGGAIGEGAAVVAQLHAVLADVAPASR